MRRTAVLLSVLIMTQLIVNTVNAQSEAKPEGDVEVVMQRLSPSLSVVPRPKDWFFAEAHGSNSRTWIISAEDTSGNQPYITGVKTEIRFYVSKTTGLSPKEFATKFLDERGKMEGVKLLATTKETAVGPFRVMTIKIDQGEYRILHTVYWGTGSYDTVVFITRGTKIDLWDKHQVALDKAGHGDLRKLVVSTGLKTVKKPVGKKKANTKGSMKPLSVDSLVLEAQLSELGYKVVNLERMKTGHLVVTVKVNESGELRFMCDSGANRTGFTPETCSSLKLETSAANGGVSGVGGELLNTAMARVESFRIGQSKVTFSKVLVIDLAQLNKQIVTGGGQPIDGIVGSDWMKARGALLDVAGARLFYKTR